MSSDSNNMRSNFLQIILLSACMAGIVSASSLYYYHTKLAPKIVVVDLVGIVAEQRNQYLSDKLTLDQVKENIKIIKERLESYPDNYVLVTRESVVAGGDSIDPINVPLKPAEGK